MSILECLKTGYQNPLKTQDQIFCLVDDHCHNQKTMWDIILEITIHIPVPNDAKQANHTT